MDGLEIETGTEELLPQATTEPSVFNAAKASRVEKILSTPERTIPKLLPPEFVSPHVTTEPSFFNAANAELFE